MGGGRLKKEDTIDYSVGLKINKKIGDYVDEDTDIVEIYVNKEKNTSVALPLSSARNFHSIIII